MKKKFNWDEFCNKNNKIAVHCTTEEEATVFCNSMHEHGLIWSIGVAYSQNTCWNDCKNDTCYTSQGTYGEYDFFKKVNYIIYEFSDFDFLSEKDIYCGKIEPIKFVDCDIAINHHYQKTIKIKYHNVDISTLEYIEGKSDWIDLRAAEDVTLKQGEFKLISLGVSMQLPKGYEAIVVPRSSTFKNFGVIQTNGIGVIDESYCGDCDVWKFPALAMRDTEIHANDRICQFRIQKHQPTISFEEVDKLSDNCRGGFGSTGQN